MPEENKKPEEGKKEEGRKPEEGKKKVIAVTLQRSPIGRKPRHRQCIQGLGLRRIRQTRLLEDTPAVRRMIAKVRDMVSCEEVSS